MELHQCWIWRVSEVKWNAPYHPASNGLAEQAVQTFKSGMKKLTSGTLETWVVRFLFDCRITPQTTTGVSPSELLFGHHLHCHLDLLHPNIEAKVHQNQCRQKELHDFHARERVLEILSYLKLQFWQSMAPWCHLLKDWSCFIYSRSYRWEES